MAFYFPTAVVRLRENDAWRMRTRMAVSVMCDGYDARVVSNS